MYEDEEPNQETLDEWHKDPDNWLWGVLYYNPRDKRLFVLKRVALFGITMNFANPKAFLLLAVFVAVIVVVVRLDRLH